MDHVAVLHEAAKTKSRRKQRSNSPGHMENRSLLQGNGYRVTGGGKKGSREGKRLIASRGLNKRTRGREKNGKGGVRNRVPKKSKEKGSNWEGYRGRIGKQKKQLTPIRWW